MEPVADVVAWLFQWHLALMSKYAFKTKTPPTQKLTAKISQECNYMGLITLL